eukprot:CAMPEP_0196579656 /NCGR_PEP_ID=MMETSP1081-20130531/24160_1 /TAXON_ID=36882 /ORGANISM="Pyramimonas amylifera, Strain CCMP720" /LENGTH=254 /DNA_ID=CAMNT_0041899303 /DNA_START=158 /DNA_END=922 /DNA_ORIENTATION=+
MFSEAGPSMMGKSDDCKYSNMESGIPDLLYPGVSQAENILRLGFIRKVYGILSAQMVLTAAVSGTIVLNDSIKNAMVQTPGLLFLAAFLPLVGLIPLYCYRNSHPLNLALLAAWTCFIAVSVGITTSFYSGAIIFEALLITALVTVSLTLYTFFGVKKGQDFGYLGPMLFAGLMTLIVGGFVGFFFPMGETIHFIFALAGAGIFSLYIVYDTNELIMRHSVDEYVWASVALYLDIINLFLKMLEILQYLQGGRD